MAIIYADGPPPGRFRVRYQECGSARWHYAPGTHTRQEAEGLRADYLEWADRQIHRIEVVEVGDGLNTPFAGLKGLLGRKEEAP